MFPQFVLLPETEFCSSWGCRISDDHLLGVHADGGLRTAAKKRSHVALLPRTCERACDLVVQSYSSVTRRISQIRKKATAKKVHERRRED